MNQPHIHMYPLHLGLPSHSGPLSAVSGVPCVYRVFLLVIYFTQSINSVHVIPSLPIPLTTHFPLGVHIFVLCIRVSIFALQI